MTQTRHPGDDLEKDQFDTIERKLDAILDNQEDILEKLANLDLPGIDYRVYTSDGE